MSQPVRAACSSPSGDAGSIAYVSSDMKYCDGSSWKTLTVSNTGISCSGSPGKTTISGTDLRYCNGSTWININSSVTNGSCSGTLGKTSFASGKINWCNGSNWVFAGPDGSCTLPWGGTIGSGSSVTAYSSATPAGTCASVSETRTCTSGSLSGSFTNNSCSNGCTGTPWGNVSHGYSNTAYQYSSGTCSNSETRTCTNGTMSGSYTYTSCDSTGLTVAWLGYEYAYCGYSGCEYSTGFPTCPAWITSSGQYCDTTYDPQICAIPWGGGYVSIYYCDTTL